MHFHRTLMILSSHHQRCSPQFQQCHPCLFGRTHHLPPPTPLRHSQASTSAQTCKPLMRQKLFNAGVRYRMSLQSRVLSIRRRSRSPRQSMEKCHNDGQGTSRWALCSMHVRGFNETVDCTSGGAVEGVHEFKFLSLQTKFRSRGTVLATPPWKGWR